MRYRFKTWKGLTVAACAVVGVLAPASAAAASPRLTLTLGGVPYSGATQTALVFALENSVTCEQGSKGQIDNQKSVLYNIFEEGGAYYYTGCYTYTPEFEFKPEYTTTAGFTKLALSWNGQVKTEGTALISTPGPCVYQLHGLVSTMSIPGYTFASGSAAASLKRAASNINCKPTLTVPWYVDLFGVNETEGIEPFTTELRG